MSDETKRRGRFELFEVNRAPLPPPPPRPWSVSETRSPSRYAPSGYEREWVVVDATGKPVCTCDNRDAAHHVAFGAADDAPDLLSQRNRLLALLDKVYEAGDALFPDAEDLLAEPWAKAALAEMAAGAPAYQRSNDGVHWVDESELMEPDAHRYRRAKPPGEAK